MKKGVKATYITAGVICLSSLLLYLFYVVFDVGLNLYNDKVLDYYINIDIEGSLIGSIGTIMLFLVGILNLVVVNKLRNQRIVQMVFTAVLTAVSYCMTLASFNMHLSPLIEKYDRYGHYLSMDALEIAIPVFVVTLIIVTTLFYLPAIYLCFMTYYVHKIEKQEAYNDEYKPKMSITSIVLGAVSIVFGGVLYVFIDNAMDTVNPDYGTQVLIFEFGEQASVFFLVFGVGLLIIGAIISAIVAINKEKTVPSVASVQTTTFVPVTPTSTVSSTNSFCENCGTKLEESFAFCLNCGTKVKK